MRLYLSASDLLDIDERIKNSSYNTLIITSRETLLEASFQKYIKFFTRWKKHKNKSVGRLIVRMLKEMAPLYMYDKVKKQRYLKVFSEKVISSGDFEQDLALVQGNSEAWNCSEGYLKTAQDIENLTKYTIEVAKDALGVEKVAEVLDHYNVGYLADDKWSGLVSEIEIFSNYAVCPAFGEEGKRISIAFF